MKPLAIISYDTGGFLAPVLKRVQTERRDGRCIRMPVDAEHAALFAQPIGIEFFAQQAFVGIGHRLPFGFDQLAHVGSVRSVVARNVGARRPAGRTHVGPLVRRRVGRRLLLALRAFFERL